MKNFLWNILHDAVKIASEMADAKYGNGNWSCRAGSGIGCSWSIHPQYTDPFFSEGEYRNCSDGIERLLWKGVQYTNLNPPIPEVIALSFFESAEF